VSPVITISILLEKFVGKDPSLYIIFNTLGNPECAWVFFMDGSIGSVLPMKVMRGTQHLYKL
jgi:hypothetical protein